ncbi:uncharacterized protein BO80DRAFT_359594, partial [Aspergillus ibericus CBS 121593]
VVLKEINLNTEEGVSLVIIRKISLLKYLIYKNILILYDVVITEDKLVLIFEYINNNLKCYINI